MSLSGKKIGIAFTGSFCTYARIFEELKALQKEGAVIQTIFSNSAQRIDSRFGTAESFLKKAEEITGIPPILTIKDAEPCHLSLHWKYTCKTCKWNHRHPCLNGSKSPS